MLSMITIKGGYMESFYDGKYDLRFPKDHFNIYLENRVKLEEKLLSDYFDKVHNIKVDDIKKLTSTFHNVKFKHLHKCSYQGENSTHYAYKGEVFLVFGDDYYREYWR